jgi:hypothetical protein
MGFQRQSSRFGRRAPRALRLCADFDDHGVAQHVGFDIHFDDVAQDFDEYVGHHCLHEHFDIDDHDRQTDDDHGTAHDGSRTRLDVDDQGGVDNIDGS